MRARLIGSVVGFCCLASLSCSSKVGGSKLDGTGNTAGRRNTRESPRVNSALVITPGATALTGPSQRRSSTA